jgi:hypothetical protein
MEDPTGTSMIDITLERVEGALGCGAGVDGWRIKTAHFAADDCVPSCPLNS